ncbi:MAG TPA: hypothetical protein VGS20_03390, partial [Candidatus Acidoferrales bacterium]|nr:hypothetical protein [Candidatus Acidoferrales bacterium]
SVGSTLGTQPARGQAYYDLASGIQTTATSAGSYPYVGTIWWQYVDSWSEKLNWGLVTNLDNAYDGHEAVRGPAKAPGVACSAPLRRRNCGGEARNYGDVITFVKRANRYWLGH